MMKSITKLCSSLLLLALMILMANQADAQVKRVILEQYTGAWCGWCVDGTVIMDQILEDNPGRVIGVKVHGGDAMATTDGNAVIQGLGVSGYPSGSVDRKVFNVGGDPAIALSRNAWEQACDIVLQEAPKADVVCTWSILPGSNTLKCQVDVTFLETVSNEVRINAYLCEDYVTGTGSGYDQKNYLSGRSGYEDNPYYTKPSVITGYEHMKVVRAFLGGPWGAEGSVSNATAGSKHSYVFTKELDASWNQDNLWVAGFVAEYTSGSRTILNSAMGVVGTASSELTSKSGGSHSAEAEGDAFNPIFQLKNVSGSSQTYVVSIEKTTRTPADWTAAMNSAAEITLADGETADVDVTLTPGATRGIGDVNIEVAVKGDPGAMKSSGKFTVISNELEKFQIVDDDAGGQYSIANELQQTNHDEYFTLEVGDFIQVYDKMTNLSHILWNCGDGGGIGADEASAISALISNGNNVMLSGNLVAYFLNENAPALLGTFGARYLGVCRQGYSTGSITLQGFDGDPISDGMTISATLAGYLTISIQNSLPTSDPVLHHSVSEDSVVAVRNETDNNRLILMGLNFGIIPNTNVRNSLIDKCVQWLEGTASIGPRIAVSTELLDFGEVDINETKDMTINIESTGDEALTITGMEIEGGSGSAFSIKDAPSFPVTVDASGPLAITLTFAPTEDGDFNDDLNIISNAPDSPKEVSMMGEGNDPGAVNDGVYGIEGIFTMNAGPNPFSEQTVITYTVGGTDAQPVEMIVVDASGREVQRLVDRNIAPGQYTLELNANSFANGTYYLIARINDFSEQLPLVIVK